MEADSPPGVPIPEGSRQQVPVRIGEQTSQRPVITSKQTGASFVLLSVLVSDKNQTTILLGGPAYEEGCGLAVHPTARVIVKAVKLSWLSDDRAERPLEELAVLWHLRTDPSPHVVQLVDHMQDGHHLYIVLRYLGGGDLFERVSASSGGVSPHEACRYLTHMARGLRHLKRHNIAHGDLSLENAVLWGPEEGGRQGCSLIDLGMCRVLPPGATGCVDTRPRGKPSYIAPEVLNGASVPLDPFAADVWSLGICLYAMLTGRPLYADPQDPAFALLARGRANELLRHYHNFGLALGQQAHELVCAMLSPNPALRPTVEEVLEHSWVLSHSEPGGAASGASASPATTSEADNDADDNDMDLCDEVEAAEAAAKGQATARSCAKAGAPELLRVVTPEAISSDRSALRSVSARER